MLLVYKTKSISDIAVIVEKASIVETSARQNHALNGVAFPPLLKSLPREFKRIQPFASFFVAHGIKKAATVLRLICFVFYKVL